MADINNLKNFLQDVADSIKTKKDYDSSVKIPAEDFDTEIASIETGVDTSDATATSNDVISPKVFYNANGRQVGALHATYKTVNITDMNTIIGSSNCSNLMAVSYENKVLAINNSNTSITFHKFTDIADSSYGDAFVTLNIGDYETGTNTTKKFGTNGVFLHYQYETQFTFIFATYNTTQDRVATNIKVWAVTFDSDGNIINTKNYVITNSNRVT